MIKKASYSIFDILGFNAGFYVRDLDLDPGDEMVDSPTSTNNLFFSSTSRFLERVSLISWTVTPSSKVWSASWGPLK